MPAPNVFAYLDYRAFLKDWFDARKREDPAYSYAVFARDGGCSKASLANVIGGARAPRPTTLDAFALAMSLDPTERNYLGLLADLLHATDLGQRRKTMEQILTAERYQRVKWAESGSETDIARYLEFWYLPAIRELAGLPGFIADPAWIASRLQPSITVPEAAAALSTLFDLGFLIREEDGTVSQREIRFRTALDAQQKAAATYHAEVIPSLMRTIDAKRSKEQHLLAMTVAFDPTMIQEVKARMNALFEQLGLMADESPSQESDRVYQVGMQLLPVSKALG